MAWYGQFDGTGPSVGRFWKIPKDLHDHISYFGMRLNSCLTAWPVTTKDINA
jgi:hypothetical protein